MTSNQPIALITGGNRGIGRSTALHLARGGVDSIITYRGNAAEAGEVAAAIRELGREAAVLQLDVSDTSGFQGFAASLGETLEHTWDRDTFDFLVNNAGMSGNGAFADVTVEDFDMLVDVHFKGVFFLTQRLLGQIADGGSIINLSSGLARATFPERVAYASVKGAVETLTLYLAQELGPRGINVNVVAPGAVATDFNDGAVRDNPEFQEGLASVTAMGRYAVADDIGPVIASLLGEGNHWVTGQRIEASGGQHI